MSQRERQPWASTAGAIAAPPPKSGAVSAMRAPPPSDSLPLTISPWELLYRGVTPAQQADLLALARQQGLLYSYQLPAPPSRPLPKSDEPPGWGLLNRMLAGQLGQLDAVYPQPVEVVDTALDDMQRHAVALALATPDVCLIQGLPGAGKSRVIAEIVTQACQRGDRVLLLSCHAAGLDRVLEQVAQRDSVCPIRCISSEEHVEQLPTTIRALTLAERTTAVRTQTLKAARETKQTAELQCARRRHEEPLWMQLETLAAALADEQTHLARAEARLAGVETEVRHEAEAATGKLAGDIRALQRIGDSQQAELGSESATIEKQRDQDSAALGALEAEITPIKPLADAKVNGRWWSPPWWKATFSGDCVGKLKQLEGQKTSRQVAIEAANKRLLELADARQHLAEKTAADIQARLQSEIQSRQQKHSAAIRQHQAEVQRHQTLWDDLTRQIDPETLRPQSRTREAVILAQQQWQSHRQQDETRCAFAREWAEFLESSIDALAERLPGYANLIAATPLSLAADPHFNDAGSQFDLLVLDEADQLVEADFHKAARRAHRWVLVGEPTLPTEAAHNGRSQSPSRVAAGSRGQHFQQLWQTLHCDPAQIPSSWFKEGERLGCRLKPLDPGQRRCLEIEPLADAPDVELRILALPRSRPELAEVLFPGATTIADAKEFLFREMQEITVQAASPCMRCQETPAGWEVHFGSTPQGVQAMTLDPGVREYLADAQQGLTCKLEFDRSAGWDRAAVEQWLHQRLGLRCLGRTVRLDRCWRMAPALSHLVHDLTGMDHVLSDASTGSEPCVEFVPVLAPSKHKNGDRGNGRGPRKPEQVPTGIPAMGAGLEIDLAHGTDRLPAELRTIAPAKGFANLPEARLVVRKLEELFHSQTQGNGHESQPTLAVIALYSAQADLIRNLVKQSPRLASQAASIMVGLPAAFAHREADVVLVSLTRSHTHRAVAYGEGPAALVQTLTRARQKLILIGDAGNLVRRSQWRGALDHLDETSANREAQLFTRLVRYLQGNGRHQRAFRLHEGSMA